VAGKKIITKMGTHQMKPVLLDKWEPAVLLAGLLLFFGVNLFTISLAPQPWGDEPGYTDPAVNLALGRGFTSTTWYAQTGEEFWAGNVPLHQITLAAWLKVFGFGIDQVRSINVVWVTGSLFL